MPNDTIPPVPSGLVTMKLPSDETSTIGNPMLSKLLTKCQSVKFPPVHCAPHSMMWPAKLPAASLSYSLYSQSNSCINGPNTTALSTHRPVITISAPSSSACLIPAAPRYALILIISSGIALSVSNSLTGSSLKEFS